MSFSAFSPRPPRFLGSRGWNHGPTSYFAGLRRTRARGLSRWDKPFSVTTTLLRRHAADDPPAIVFLGTKDRLIPVSVVERFKAKMEQAGAGCEVRLYDGQAHGFFNREPFQSRTLLETDKFLGSLGWLEGPPTLKTPVASPADSSDDKK